MKMNRGLMDLQRQMTRFQISENGFTESWTDPLPDMEITHPDVVAVVSQHRQAHEQQQQQQVDVAAATPGGAAHQGAPWTHELTLQKLNQITTMTDALYRDKHFPGVAIVRIVFLNTFASIVTHPGRQLDQYSIAELRGLFLEMSCATKTAVDNPMVKPSATGQTRSLLWKMVALMELMALNLKMMMVQKEFCML